MVTLLYFTLLYFTLDCQSIMTAIDFEKAFDSLNWNLLLKSLEFFGFGESVLAWIKKFYKI